MNLFSPVKKLDGMSLKPIPTKGPLKGEIISIGHNAFLFKDVKGRIYFKGIVNGAYLLGDYWFIKKLLQALVEFEFITKEEMDLHMEHVRRKEEHENKKFQANELKRVLKEAGLKPSKQQEAFMASA